MSSRHVISTPLAPAAIGAYSQAICVGELVFISGQIGLDPESMTLAASFEAQTQQVFKNLAALAEAAGSSLAEAVKLTVFLTDLSHFAKVNEIMAQYCAEPFPARAAVGVAALPRGALIEVDAVVCRLS